MSRRNRGSRWFLAGLAPLATGAVLWIGRALSRRARARKARRYTRIAADNRYQAAPRTISEPQPDLINTEMGLEVVGLDDVMVLASAVNPNAEDLPDIEPANPDADRGRWDLEQPPPEPGRGDTDERFSAAARLVGGGRPAGGQPEGGQPSAGEPHDPGERRQLVPVTAHRPAARRPEGRGRGASVRPGKNRDSVRVYETPPGMPPGTHRAGEAAVERGRFPWPLLLLFVLLAGLGAYSLLGRRPARVQVNAVPAGDPAAGRRALQSWGCGSCHVIPGVPGAYGKVGPQLDQMAEQTYIAGMLPNTPDNLILWIMDPQVVQPGNAMPDTDVNLGMARDMAAYLYAANQRRGIEAFFYSLINP